jgi:hypothetical protein
VALPVAKPYPVPVPQPFAVPVAKPYAVAEPHPLPVSGITVAKPIYDPVSYGYGYHH